MLSYRHAFHAGNPADVLKHIVLLQLLEYFNRKEKPYLVVDTHAGAGGYALDEGYALKNAEFAAGVGRLFALQDGPAALQDYLVAIRHFNSAGVLRFYPGSPLLARRMMREQDRLRLFELHPADAQLLMQRFRGDRQVRVEMTDGLAGLRAVLPPPSRRGLVLIDPSWEDRQDYLRVPEVLQDALKRFATGTYAVWYPLLSRSEAVRLPGALERLGGEWLRVELRTASPPADGFGMYGSGMFVLNPPWVLEEALRQVMPLLVGCLAGKEGGFSLQARLR